MRAFVPDDGARNAAGAVECTCAGGRTTRNACAAVGASAFLIGDRAARHAPATAQAAAVAAAPEYIHFRAAVGSCRVKRRARRAGRARSARRPDHPAAGGGAASIARLRSRMPQNSATP